MIYLDNNATTPILSEVRAAMLPFLGEEFGNPSGIYSLGQRAKTAVEKARYLLSKILDVLPTELTFTGSGTEAINQAILGALFAAKPPRNHVVISAIEHAAVERTVEFGRRFGFDIRIAPIGLKGGAVDVQPFADSIDERTALVCVMHANNETGLVLPVAEIFDVARAHGALCFADCVQSFGKLDLKPGQMGCDMAGMSAHKFHGPKGVGCLYVRRGVDIQPLIHGGSQENQRRGGTENVAGIVGMAAAAQQVATWDTEPVTQLRDAFEQGIVQRLGNKAKINFADCTRVGNTSSIQFPGTDANILLIKLDRQGICASTGAACHSGSLSTSPVLRHMGLTEAEAKSTVRFSFSKLNTRDDITATLDALQEIVNT